MLITITIIIVTGRQARRKGDFWQPEQKQKQVEQTGKKKKKTAQGIDRASKARERVYK
jgi:hypothetical protein